MIAAAALRLAARGALDLDAALPEQAFTMRQVLAHRAGLGCYGGLRDYHAAVAARTAPWGEAELLDRVGPPVAPPGTVWRYSNVGYLLARRHLEQATGLPLGALLEREVLGPAGCAATRLAVGVEDLPHLPGAAGYDFGWVYHGCLLGPPAEAVRVVAALPRLLGAEGWAAMTAGRIVADPIPGRPWTRAAYGLGAMCGDMRGVPVAGHSGAGPVSTCAVYLGPRGAAATFSRRTWEASAERAVARVVA